MKPSKTTTLLEIIKFEDYDDLDLLMFAIKTALNPADRALLSKYAETPNNNISELARSLKSSNYIVKKELFRIKECVITRYEHLKTL